MQPWEKPLEAQAAAHECEGCCGLACFQENRAWPLVRGRSSLQDTSPGGQGRVLFPLQGAQDSNSLA